MACSINKVCFDLRICSFWKQIFIIRGVTDSLWLRQQSVKWLKYLIKTFKHSITEKKLIYYLATTCWMSNISIYAPGSENEQNTRVSQDVIDEPDINMNYFVYCVTRTLIQKEIDAGN